MAEASKSSDNQKPELSKEKDTLDDFEAPNTTNKDHTVKKIYVNNFSGKISKINLQGIFSVYGRIESSRVSKKGRGNNISADITFVSPTDALKAFEAGKRKEIKYNGKTLNVVLAFPNLQSNDKRTLKKKNSKKLKAQEAQNNETGKLDFINMLDDDCLIHIFVKLPMIHRFRIERVCKRWQDVSARAFYNIKELSLSRELLEHDANIKLWHVNNRAIEKLLIRCGRFLTYLKLSTKDLCCTSDVFPIIGEHCHNLEKMILQFHKYSNKNMHKLFTQTIKIQYLEIEEIEKDFKDVCLINLTKTGLKELRLSAKVTNENFSSCYRHLSQHAPATFRKLKDLKSLALNGFLLKPEKIKAICYNKNLTSLSLTNCTIKKLIYKICDLPNLQYLNLCKVPEVSNQLLTELAVKCPQLNYLNISHCVAVDNFGITALAKLTNLQTLLINELYEVQDEVLGNLIYLETLHCENCEQIYDPGINKLIETAPNLKHLNLFNTSVSVDVLNFANSVMKRRTNELLLHVVVNSSVYDELELEEDKSPLLDIESKDDSLWDEFWNGSDDEFEDDDDDDYDQDFDDFFKNEWDIQGFECDYDSADEYEYESCDYDIC